MEIPTPCCEKTPELDEKPYIISSGSCFRYKCTVCGFSSPTYTDKALTETLANYWNYAKKHYYVQFKKDKLVNT